MVCEPFRQWVIEDRFPQGRPAWKRCGAELVCDVRPYVEMKLRLLNGSHSSIAYLGQLAGWRTVAEAIAVPELRAHVAALMDEVAATLTLPATVDLNGYRDALLVRLANPALHHRTAQILLGGRELTLGLAALTVLCSLLIGGAVGLARCYGPNWLRVPLVFYIDSMRAVPVLVVLVWSYFALPIVTGVTLPPFWAALVALSLHIAAYVAEIVRAGVISVRPAVG